MRTLIRRWARLASAALCAGLLLAVPTGCNRGPDLKLVPVSGRVTYDGRPVTTGSISFRPDTAKGNSSPYEPAGDIDANGNYKLYTAGKEGAPPGWYKVAVVSTAEPDPENPSAVPKSFIPRKYGEPTNSGLEKEVVEQPPTSAYDIDLK